MSSATPIPPQPIPHPSSRRTGPCAWCSIPPRAKGWQALQRFPIDKGHPPQQQARAAVAQASGGIVGVAGGDGTINTVAQSTLGSGCAFGVLPQGTFNYFARNHGIPLETREALQVLLHQAPQPVQVGLVNERVFLVNASLGIYAQLLEDREAFKSRDGRNRLVALGAALRTLASQHRPWDLRLAWGGEVQTLSFRSLDVAPTRGALRRRVKVATDGEVAYMQMPLVFHVAPEPLWLIKPEAAR